MKPEDHPLPPRTIKRLLDTIRHDGRILYSRPHALARMKKRNITTVDVVNVLRGGMVQEGELENGAWRYRVCTNRFCVVVQFLSSDVILVVTVIRYD